MSYLLGIDLGTSSVKTLLMDTTGKILTITNEKYPILTPHVGWAEQNPEVWWQATAKTIQYVLNESGADASCIKGIGLSGQMHGLVTIDDKCNVIRPAIVWADLRSVSECDEIYQTIGKKHFSDITLNPVVSGFLLPSLLWMKKHEPDNYRRIDKVLLPKDYIRLRLTQTLGTDYSDASGSMAFDTANSCWSYKILDQLGIDGGLFPECNSAHHVAGTVHEQAALQCGLHTGTPVVYGGGDQLMQAIGNGIIFPGLVSSNIGTASQISSPIMAAIYDDELRTQTFHHVIDGMWNLVGASLSGGISLKWFRDQFVQGKNFSDLDLMVSQIEPACEGLIFLPYLSGERTPYLDPAARGIFFGIGLNHTLNHFTRSVMEGVVYALKDSLDILKAKGIKTDKLIASGGGAISRQWLQMQADIFDSEIHTTNSKEQACLGAAIVAGYGVGIYTSIQEACKELISFNQDIVLPNSANVAIYKEKYPIFQEIYQRNKTLFPLANKTNN